MSKELRELLRYEPETGAFTWKERAGGYPQWNARYAGKPAGRVTARGYVVLKIFERPYYAHRLAWLCAYGRWPQAEIDHINGDKSDNRLSNLRECQSAENKANRDTSRGDRRGIRLRPSGRWEAIITVANKQRFLGTFASEEGARAAYRAAAQRAFGRFARVG